MRYVPAFNNVIILRNPQKMPKSYSCVFNERKLVLGPLDEKEKVKVKVKAKKLNKSMIYPELLDDF